MNDATYRLAHRVRGGSSRSETRTPRARTHTPVHTWPGILSLSRVTVPRSELRDSGRRPEHRRGRRSLQPHATHSRRTPLWRERYPCYSERDQFSRRVNRGAHVRWTPSVGHHGGRWQSKHALARRMQWNRTYESVFSRSVRACELCGACTGETLDRPTRSARLELRPGIQRRFHSKLHARTPARGPRRR